MEVRTGNNKKIGIQYFIVESKIVEIEEKEEKEENEENEEKEEIDEIIDESKNYTVNETIISK